MTRLADLYPNASHVQLVGLEHASDLVIWEFALANEYIIVTKDTDFTNLSFKRGSPPQVIWVHSGNCSVDHVEEILRRRYNDVLTLSTELKIAILSLW